VTDDLDAEAAPPRRRIAVNTAIFSVATGLSRIAGLVREVVASSYFGTRGSFSAFTLAFQVPNLVRSLVADSALSAAFVPVFTELLEQKKRKEAFRLASTLFFVILAGLGAITALFILGAGVVMPIFTGDFNHHLTELTVGLSRVLFPIVVLLGLNGLTVGILNAYDHFTIPAIAPLMWNVVIIVLLVVLKPFFHGDAQLYAYALGVLAGTVVQLGMSLPMLRRMGFHLQLAVDWRDPRIRRIFKLMLPVTLGLGIINFDLLINSSLGSLVSNSAPRAIDAAFRIYMLPQGMFSVALATVLFPAMARFAARGDRGGMSRTLGNGVRQIYLMLIPAAAFTVALSVPIVRLVYQRGAFTAESTHQVAQALFWFSFSLPFAGVNLLLTRTFFSLQQPWKPTALAGVNMLVNATTSLALYKPLGIPGLVIGTALGSLGMALGQSWYLSRELGGIEGRKTVLAVGAICLAATGAAGLGWLTWLGFERVFGGSLIAQVISVGAAITVGSAFYTGGVLFMEIPEARQIQRLVMSRVRAAQA
jgi:putative peptidoglycan lipid II flippase